MAIQEDLKRISKLNEKVSDTIKTWHFINLEMLDFNLGIFKGVKSEEIYNDSPITEVITLD